MRSTGHAWSYKAWCSAVIGCFSTALIGAFRSLLFTQRFVVLLDRGHPRFWNYYSTIPVDVVRVKSFTNSLFDPARVVIRVTTLPAPQQRSDMHHALWDHAWPVDLIAWRRLAVCSRNVAIYITRDYIVRQTKNLAYLLLFTTMNNHNLFQRFVYLVLEKNKLKNFT